MKNISLATQPILKSRLKPGVSSGQGLAPGHLTDSEGIWYSHTTKQLSQGRAGDSLVRARTPPRHCGPKRACLMSMGSLLRADHLSENFPLGILAETSLPFPAGSVNWSFLAYHCPPCQCGVFLTAVVLIMIFVCTSLSGRQFPRDSPSLGKELEMGEGGLCAEL